MIIKRYILIFTTLIVTASLTEEFSVQEKIKIHQEWLKGKYLHHKIKSSSNDITLRKLFHNNTNEIKNKENFIKKSKLLLKEDHSKNDAYVEIEKNDDRTTTTTTTTSSSIHHLSSSTSMPELITTLSNDVVTTPITQLHKLNLSENHLKSEILPTLTTNDSFSKSQDKIQFSLPSKKPKSRRKRVKKRTHWSPWSHWSECTRSCGGGVMYQTRHCLSKLKSNNGIPNNDCPGIYKRYRLCNAQDCPTEDDDFRYQQCSSYNNVLFYGKRYQWEAYIKDDAECELNCKPIGMNYFATLNKTVIDGTSCTRPAEYYRKNYRGPAICVEGICKTVHPNGVISSSFVNKTIVHCGALLCRTISKIFKKHPDSTGYTHVTTIMAGASNISITELKNSPNYLVLKIPSENKYIINGDYTLSSGGTYEAVGTIFDYHRIDINAVEQNNHAKQLDSVTEWITSAGPILEPIELLVYGQSFNPGIKYEYLLPIASENDLEENSLNSVLPSENEKWLKDEMEPKLKSAHHYNEILDEAMRYRRKFNWKLIGFGPCSKSCGGGIQIPIIRCIRKGFGRHYAEKYCSNLKKPVINDSAKQCNIQPCPAYWRVEEWSDCFCKDEVGLKTREVHCVQKLTMDIDIQVHDAACVNERPISKKKCNCPRISKRLPHHLRIEKSSKTSEFLLNDDTITHKRISSLENKNFGNWLMSEWNEKCSSNCEIGIEHRSIFCDRQQSTNQICDIRLTPDSVRPCQNKSDCSDAADWFVGSWKQCNGNCFNLTKSRSVICVRNSQVVNNTECVSSEKPKSILKCSIEEVNYCGPNWHYSVWSDCTKVCGVGNQKRSVKCLKYDLLENTLKESTKCLYSKRQPIYRECNTHKC